jgi:RNA polymerase sigma-70 factor (ECF subfamily)
LTVTAHRSNARPLPEDFEQTFREHHQLIYRAALRITGRAEDAEDVVQTLFLRLLRRDRTLDIEKSPKAYLHRAAVNIALDLIKVRNRNASAGDDAMLVQDGAPGQERRSTGAEIQQWLRAALAELSPKVAEMFVLRHIEGYDNAEIAKMLGTSRGTVAVLLFRARGRLKRSLKTHLGERP